MEKPILLTRHVPAGGHTYWTIRTRDLGTLIAFGIPAKIAKRYNSAEVRRTKTGITLGPHSDHPGKFLLAEAEHVAHQLGRYKLGLGDMMFAYVDTLTIEGGESEHSARIKRIEAMEAELAALKAKDRR